MISLQNICDTRALIAIHGKTSPELIMRHLKVSPELAVELHECYGSREILKRFSNIKLQEKRMLRAKRLDLMSNA